MKKSLLGIDVGTSGTKVALYGVDGTLLAAHTAEYPMLQPQNGWAEQNPIDWWNATVEGIRAVLSETVSANAGIASAENIEIAGIGLSGQMHGLVLLDAAGEVLRPAIIWCDQRTSAEVEYMKALAGEKLISEISANPPMTGFTAAKILWVQKNEPKIYEKCEHILLPKDYIRYKLTGEFATDVSDASGTQLLDVSKREWSGELALKFGIRADLLPKLYESQEITGALSEKAEGEIGLAAGIPVVAGAGDNAAAAVGVGVVAEGKAFTTIGTSAVVYAVSDEPRIDAEGRVHTFCASVPGKWTAMSCTQSAGLSLRWLRDTICTAEADEAAKEGIDPYVLMDRLAETAPIGADKLLFLPYLMGERSPHPDPDARGVFFGLSAIHTRANLIRAVMEGVAYSQLECANVFREMGISLGDMTAIGGGARSGLWRKMLADLYAIPVKTPKPDGGAAFGAAILAGVGVGIYESLEEACAGLLQIGEVSEPDPSRHEAYMPYFELYKKLYKDLKGDYKVLASYAPDA